jgi:hypothetical protein
MPYIYCQEVLIGPTGDVLQGGNGKLICLNTKTPYSTHIVILYVVLLVQRIDCLFLYLTLSIYFLLLLLGPYRASM